MTLKKDFESEHNSYGALGKRSTFCYVGALFQNVVMNLETRGTNEVSWAVEDSVPCPMAPVKGCESQTLFSFSTRNNTSVKSIVCLLVRLVQISSPLGCIFGGRGYEFHVRWVHNSFIILSLLFMYSVSLATHTLSIERNGHVNHLFQPSLQKQHLLWCVF